MNEPLTRSVPVEVLAGSAKPRRTRRFMKRAHFKAVPRMPRPVKALWEAASEEEKIKAHQTCVVMLQHWLGRLSKAEAAAQLKLTPLRVWQLSQQAVAGMVAGLLKQPRWQRSDGAAPMPQNPDEDPKRLKARIVELERKLKLAEDLIQLLKEFPVHKAEAKAAERAQKASGEEKPGVLGRKRKRSGTRKSTSGSSPTAGAGLADGAGTDPAP